MERAHPLVRPARTDEWLIVAMNERVVQRWERWAKQEPNALAATYDRLAQTPIALTPRQKRLVGTERGYGTYEGRTFERWQYEVTSGGRIFYFVDDPTDGGKKKPERRGKGLRPRRRVIIEAVYPGHPKSTEHKHG